MINILLVEDNPINQFVAAKTLRASGMEVMIANHGQEALAMIEKKSFHLVLMDLDMPVMDGYESTRKIRGRADSYSKTVPIIAFSASEITDAKGKAMASGMDDFMMKPLQQNELQNAIDKYVFGNMESEDNVRPLNIDFNQYTGGDDGLNRELAALMMTDIVELQKTLTLAIQLKDAEMFRNACHKSKTTLSMVNDKEFLELIESLKKYVMEGKDTLAEGFVDQVRIFNRISADLLRSFSVLTQRRDDAK